MRRYNREEKTFSDINITPFTDVILVLLIIFMITSPFLISGAFKVKLPDAAAAETSVKMSAEVYLTSDNLIYINSRPIPREELPIVIKQEFVKYNNFEVIVKADKNVPYGLFVKLLDQLKAAGAGKILLAATKTPAVEPQKTGEN
ncbi:MAG: biopolymer transporter ExbD [Ignavibacteriaceae bacterium]|nr:biopolymer transporter ExbD [Ignavibacteriaceae bacterium]